MRKMNKTAADNRNILQTSSLDHSVRHDPPRTTIRQQMGKKTQNKSPAEGSGKAPTRSEQCQNRTTTLERSSAAAIGAVRTQNVILGSNLKL